MLRSVRALPAVEPSAGFEARLFARIRAERSLPARSRWWQDFARIPVPAALGAAALLLVAVFSYTYFSARAPFVAETGRSTAGRTAAPDTVPTRTNTRPSFLGGFSANDVGLTAGADLVGPPYPMEGRHRSIAIAVPCDLNGAPIEGPFEPVSREHLARPGHTPVSDSAGKVDTSSPR
jgi:hypothetical protein